MLGVRNYGQELVRRVDDFEIDPELVDGRPRSRAGQLLRCAGTEYGHLIEREDLDPLVEHQLHSDRAVESARKKTNRLHRMPPGLRRARVPHQNAPCDRYKGTLVF